MAFVQVCLTVAIGFVSVPNLAATHSHEDWDIFSTSKGLYEELLEEERKLIKALAGAKVGSSMWDIEPYDYSHQYTSPWTYGGYGRSDMDGYRRPELEPISLTAQRSGYAEGSYEYKQQQSGSKRRQTVFRLPPKNTKKMKIVSIDKGFYIPGGIQMFGKFKSVKGCMKACALTPNCFAGDYNAWFGRCYMHGNFSACGTLRAHKKLVHFKKVPCTVPDAPAGLIVLGAQLFKAMEQKGVSSLTECIKKCASAGAGIQTSAANLAQQICFGIDFNFASHQCYFHVDNDTPENRICNSAGGAVVTPRDLVANPSTVFIALCTFMAFIHS